ncbi:unnamed protein product [Linum tenue]|uniref:Dirigent protein n=1 Tax=Linum tenue TaxID=586396 RepID=A0AAV0JF64_9ROSI|nr:unnamed protein product [Linum tenue]
MSRRAMLIILIFISMAVLSSSAQQPPLNWARRLDSGDGPESVTNLQFYFHDLPGGKNPTAVQVVKPASSGTSINSFFGSVAMADDALTESADAGSKVVGRAQGLYGFDSQSDLTLMMSMSYVFTDGPYSGSSLSVVGRNPTMDTNRELPVMGGTGLFRMARGYALLRTVSLDASGDAVVYYNVTVHAPASNYANAQIISPAGGGGGAPALLRR